MFFNRRTARLTERVQLLSTPVLAIGAVDAPSPSRVRPVSTVVVRPLSLRVRRDFFCETKCFFSPSRRTKSRVASASACRLLLRAAAELGRQRFRTGGDWAGRFRVEIRCTARDSFGPRKMAALFEFRERGSSVESPVFPLDTHREL